MVHFIATLFQGHFSWETHLSNSDISHKMPNNKLLTDPLVILERVKSNQALVKVYLIASKSLRAVYKAQAVLGLYP